MLFKRVKFISPNGLDWGKAIQQYCYKGLNLDLGRKEFWERNLEHVRRAINKKRSNIGNKVGKGFQSE